MFQCNTGTSKRKIGSWGAKFSLTPPNHVGLIRLDLTERVILSQYGDIHN